MDKAKLVFDGKEIEVGLLTLTPALRLKIATLEMQLNDRIEQCLNDLLHNQTYLKILDSSEITILHSFTNVVPEVKKLNEKKQKAGKNSTVSESEIEKVFQELSVSVQPVWSKLREYATASCQDWYMIEKVKLVVNFGFLDEAQKTLFGSTNDSDFWMNQPSVNLEEINEFFRGYKK